MSAALNPPHGAGIRLLRLKKSVRQLPPPEEFRQRLEGAALGSAQDDAAFGGGRIDEVPVLTNEVRLGHGGRLETESMSLTDLMGFPQTQR